MGLGVRDGEQYAPRLSDQCCWTNGMMRMRRIWQGRGVGGREEEESNLCAIL